VRELDEMADQFVVFLEKWYALFPEYEHDDVGSPSLLPLSQVLTWLFRSTSPESRTPANTSPTSRSTSSPGTSSQPRSTSGI
jgi:carboxypeptidase D